MPNFYKIRRTDTMEFFNQKGYKDTYPWDEVGHRYDLLSGVKGTMRSIASKNTTQIYPGVSLDNLEIVVFTESAVQTIKYLG